MPSKSGLIIPGDRDFRIGPDEINRMHDFSDVDIDATSQHHTLGDQPYQAAPGTHKHALISRGYDTGQVAPNANDIPVVFTEFTKNEKIIKWGVFGGNTGAQTQRGGLWVVHFHWIRTAGGLGARNWLRIKSTTNAFDPATILAHTSILPTAEDRYSISWCGLLDEGAVLRFEFYQDSGGSTTCAGAANIIWLGP
jgi:hypothetical protein